ncbi:MAG: PEP-CTERM sorting domain-containing protein [Pirellulaceae bacterium]|nr:PEP-CTERM sorting domain-containing protein [Pirellulaceae bacterium]
MRTLFTTAMLFAVTTTANADIMSLGGTLGGTIQGLFTPVGGRVIYEPDTGEVVGARMSYDGYFRTCKFDDANGWVNPLTGEFYLEIGFHDPYKRCSWTDPENPLLQAYMNSEGYYQQAWRGGDPGTTTVHWRYVTFSVPEPSSITLMALAGLFLLRFRRP